MRFGLVPAHRFEIHTSLSPEKVLTILQANTAPRQTFRAYQDHRYFQGACGADGFKLTRLIQYRNSFLPIVTGHIAPEGAGSVVTIKMRIQLLVMAFMVFWFGFVILFGAIIAGIVHSGRVPFQPAMLIPLPMLAFGIALVLGGFWFEASKQHDKLVALLAPPL